MIWVPSAKHCRFQNVNVVMCRECSHQKKKSQQKICTEWKGLAFSFSFSLPRLCRSRDRKQYERFRSGADLRGARGALAPPTAQTSIEIKGEI